MAARRTVAVFTASRAEYGLQAPVLAALAAHEALEPALIVGGGHFDSRFGSTIDEIERDGVSIAARVPFPMDGDGVAATVQAVGAGIQALGAALEGLRPDVLVVHGDRFEALAAAVAASQMNIVTAHVEGGDLTEGGALDDSIRHAVTKLSHLHFTSHDEASERVRRLGEEPWRVHTVGLPSLDLVRQGDYASAADVVGRFGIDPERPLVVFTQHSVTTEAKRAVDQVRPALDALASFACDGVQVIATYPNRDAGGRAIVDELHRLQESGVPNLQVHTSLGRHMYHGLLALCGEQRGVCAGNSSSGIKETPAFGCPTVNIGSRQAGRLRAANVVDVGYDRGMIEQALHRGLYDLAFRTRCRNAANPYGDGRAGERIASVLAGLEDVPRILRKRMTY